jgi:hypothetical protein
VPRPAVRSNAVFLNVPYDQDFRRLYLAYIVGLVHVGLVPHATLEIPGGERRLDRILALIKSCRYSIHDLSRVQLERTAPRTPRFNMPFELGLTITWAKLNPSHHMWFVSETQPRRLQKSLSDLNGTDPDIHGGTVEGVMRVLCNSFVRQHGPRPTVPQMMKSYRLVSRQLENITKNAGSTSIYEANVFSQLRFAAGIAAKIVTS